MKIFTLIIFLALNSCSTKRASTVVENQVTKATQEQLAGDEIAYFASGCFWCVEAVFESVQGVSEVISGYSGGEKVNPTYEQVSRGLTKHAEAVKVYYDPEVIDYKTLVEVFYGSHDPTTLNRQGPDRGPHYRSAIFYRNDEEKAISEKFTAELEESGVFSAPIVTQIVAFDAWYDAEDYHQDYERLNPNQPYIRSVSVPRLNRFKSKFPHLLKETHGTH